MQNRKFAKSQWDNIMLDWRWSLRTVDAQRFKLAFRPSGERRQDRGREGWRSRVSRKEKEKDKAGERGKKMRDREDERRESERRLNAHACRLNYARPAGFTIMPPRRARRATTVPPGPGSFYGPR